MTSSVQVHGAGLRALFARLHGKAHFLSRFKLVETTARDTVAVKINFVAILGFDETVAFIMEYAGDPASRGDRMGFYIAFNLAIQILQMPARGGESVTDGGIDIFMRMVLLRIAARGDLPAARQRQINPDLEQAAIAPVPAWRPDRNPACGDAVMKPLQPADFLFNSFTHGVR